MSRDIRRMDYTDVAALVMAVSLAAIAVVSLRNIAYRGTTGGGPGASAEVELDRFGAPILLAGIPTVLLFLFSCAFVASAWLGLADPVPALQLSRPGPVVVAGSALFAAGAGLFSWSVVARGRYAVGWEMPADHELVVSGPYRYVRHPSYTGYMLMFFGMFFATLDLAAAVPLLGVLGYYILSREEERMLELRYGGRYTEYRSKTGRFAPRWRAEKVMGAGARDSSK